MNPDQLMVWLEEAWAADARSLGLTPEGAEALAALADVRRRMAETSVELEEALEFCEEIAGDYKADHTREQYQLFIDLIRNVAISFTFVKIHMDTLYPRRIRRGQED